MQSHRSVFRFCRSVFRTKRVTLLSDNTFRNMNIRLSHITLRIILLLITASHAIYSTASKSAQINKKWTECYIQHVNATRNGNFYKSVLLQAKRNLNGKTKMKDLTNVFLHLTDALIQDGEYTAALQIVQQMQMDAERLELTKEGKRIFLAECENRTGLCFVRLGVTDRAMEYFNSSRKRIENLNYPQLESKIINNIGEICYRRGSIKTAIELQQQAINCIMPLNDSTEISAYCNNLGILYMKAREYKKARKCFTKSIEYHKANDYDFLSYIYTNMAELSETEGNYRLAEKELCMAYKLQKGKSLNENILSTKLGFAKIYTKTNRIAEFNKIKGIITKELNRVGSDDYKATSLKQLSELCFSIGDSICGARFLLMSDNIHDSISQAVNDYQLQQMLVAYDTERLHNNNIILKQSLEKLQLQTRNRNLTITICVTLLILFGVCIYMLVRKNRSARIIHEQQIRLRKYEQEEHKRKETDLKNTIDTNNRRLVEYAIDQSAVNEFQQTICHKIENAMHDNGKLPAETSKILNEVISELKRQKDSQLGEDFHTYFEQVNPDFLRKLKKMFPQLTQNDIRLCAFLYLGLSTKEISALTYREVRSIETSRLRLRKKLNIDGKVSLHDYLTSINN